LLAASQLINQAVGDALSGLLLVEAILQYKRWSFQNWCEIYSDLPSRQLKVRIFFLVIFNRSFIELLSMFIEYDVFFSIFVVIYLPA
jgi:hypothetical protein